jgi:hypothetical protein
MINHPLRWHTITQYLPIRPNIDYLLVVTLSLLRAASGPNQLGHVVNYVKEYIWQAATLASARGQIPRRERPGGPETSAEE